MAAFRWPGTELETATTPAPLAPLPQDAPQATPPPRNPSRPRGIVTPQQAAPAGSSPLGLPTLPACGLRAWDMMPPCALFKGHAGDHQDGFGGHYCIEPKSGGFAIETPKPDPGPVLQGLEAAARRPTPRFAFQHRQEEFF